MGKESGKLSLAYKLHSGNICHKEIDNSTRFAELRRACIIFRRETLQFRVHLRKEAGEEISFAKKIHHKLKENDKYYNELPFDHEHLRYDFNWFLVNNQKK